VLADVIPNIPFIPAGNSTLMTPDPPRYISVAAPLIEGDLMCWDMENEMLSHGEGEQSTNVGARCP